LIVRRQMITIRDATEDDLPAIIDIYNQSIPAGRATADTKPISVAERTEWFRKFDPAQRPIWVAEESGRVIGCVYLSWFYGGRPAYEKTAEISTYIASDHQGKGLGTLLKKRMIDACPRFDVETLISMYFDHNGNEETEQQVRFRSCRTSSRDCRCLREEAGFDDFNPSNKARRSKPWTERATGRRYQYVNPRLR
jgi:L-amino acid N-acyltransferase YncA